MYIDDKDIVDAREIKKIFGIDITNPIYKRKVNSSISDKIKIGIYNYCCNNRLLNSSNMSQESETSCSFDIYNIFEKNQNNKAEPEYQNGIYVNPFFNVGFIQISEFFPKETVYRLNEKIDNFRLLFSSENRKEQTEEAYFPIKRDTSLGELFKACKIKVEEASPTFDIVSFRFYLNDELKQKMNDFAVGNTPDYDRFFGLDKLKVTNSRNAKKGFISGVFYKSYVMTSIYEELKYRVRKELGNEIFLLTNSLDSSEAFIFIETNISKDSSKIFWQSMNVYPSTLHFVKDINACVTQIGHNIVCIHKACEDKDFNEGCFDMYASDDFNQIIALENLIENSKKKISIINRWIQNCPKKGIEYWLELRKKVNEMLAYNLRFYEEYNLNIKSEWKYEQNVIGTYLKFDKLDDSMKNEIDQIKNNIKLIIKELDERFNEKNIETSYDLQHQTFITNFISAIFAFVAIVIALFGDNDTRTNALKLFISTPHLLKGFIIVVVFIPLIYIVIGVLAGIIKWIKNNVEKKTMF